MNVQRHLKCLRAAVASAILLLHIRAGVVDPIAHAVETAPAVETLEQQLFDRTNAERAAAGLPHLAPDADTIDLARWRAAQLVALPAAQISHFDSDGRMVL